MNTDKPEKPAETNGELDEAARWDRNRTGWAPRFHIPEDDMDEGETLLDHQTFIETKLDDKFFGGRVPSHCQALIAV